MIIIIIKDKNVLNDFLILIQFYYEGENLSYPLIKKQQKKGILSSIRYYYNILYIN